VRHRPVSEDGSGEGNEAVRESGRLIASLRNDSSRVGGSLLLCLFGAPCRALLLPTAGVRRLYRRHPLIRRPFHQQDLECWCLADSALQWKSARIPWLEVSPRRADKPPEVALKLLNARSITVHGNGVTLYLSGGVLGPVVGYGFHGDVRSVER
jgi:hypothetical protein